jgi:hypothetical protein
MKSVKPLPGRILVDHFMKGERKVGSIILNNDDGKTSGVRPRWARVYAVGEGIHDILTGQWILITHGRWTREHKVDLDDDNTISLWGVEYKSILGVSDSEPDFDTFNDDTGIEYVNTRMPKPGERFGVDEY